MARSEVAQAAIDGALTTGVTEIYARLAEIRKAVQQQYAALPAAERSWGHVGDLGHVESELEDLAKFLKGEDR